MHQQTINLLFNSSFYNVPSLTYNTNTMLATLMLCCFHTYITGKKVMEYGKKHNIVCILT